MWRRARRCSARPSLVSRLRYFLARRRRLRRALGWLDALGPDEPLAGCGVREPRRPLSPTLSAAASLELPDH